MSKILFISPSVQLAARAREIIAERSLEVEVQVASLKESKKIASRAVENGIKVLISRGGNASILQKCFAVPVIKVKLTSGCYIEAFEKIRSIEGPVAFFSVEEIQDNVKTLCYLMDVESNFYRFDNEMAAEDVVKKAVRDGNVLGIGGVVTEKYAGLYDLDYVTLENSREDIEMALDSAQQVLASLQREEIRRKSLQLQLQRYEVIFNYTHDGIIAIDKKGKVEVVNKQAEKILPLKNKPYEGQYIENILPSTKMHTVLRSGEMETDELMKVGNAIINTNRIPIIIDGQIEGVVATFRDIESIRISEQKIRSNLHKKGLASKYRFTDMIGESKAIQRAIRIAKGYAKNNSNILLLGEIGVGKEMFAHSIHRESRRRNMPFVVVNCANVSPVVLLADLQGYEEGSSPFGAKGHKEGMFELAHGGTLFLDKIEDAPLGVQALLLRVLEDNEVRRIGGDHVIPIDVRVIVSANKTLTKKIEEGTFLEELFYAISVLTLEIPPLRERGDDYLLLCSDWFRRSFGADFRKYEGKIKDIEEYIKGYTWKGNIRQLSNFVERVSVLLKNDMSVEEVVSTLPGLAHPADEKENVMLGKWTRAAVLEALSESKLNISRAARLLNCSRSTLYKKMDEFNIKITNGTT